MSIVQPAKPFGVRRSSIWLRLARELFWVFALAARGYCHAQNFAHQEFLWIVTNRASTVYLLGSIHSLRQSDYPLPTIFDQAFAQADRVVFEMKYDDLNSPQGLSYLSSRANYPPGETIQQHVSAVTYQLLKDYQKETGLSVSDTFRPWYQLAVISNQESKRLGYDDPLGVDRTYYDRAKAAGKPISALETAAFQIDLLADTPPDQQEKDLREILANRDAYAGSLRELVTSWKGGDLAGFAQIIERDRSADVETHARFFTDRNNRWLSQLESFLNEDKVTLVIVGAGHFVGEDGVVNLLRRKGYAVPQLPLIPTRILTVIRTDDGAAELSFELIAGHNYAVEVSSDLATWKTIHNFVSSATTRNYLDLSARGQTHRLYRLKNLDATVRP